MKESTIVSNQRKSNNTYLFDKGCHYCNNQFEDDEVYKKIEIQDGDFRGDDEVYCCHKKCFNECIKKLSSK